MADIYVLAGKDEFLFGEHEFDFCRDVLAEVKAAREKFPQPWNTMVALMEEVGELAKAMLDEPLVRVRAEAVQVACMALRVAIENDYAMVSSRLVKGLDVRGGL